MAYYFVKKKKKLSKKVKRLIGAVIVTSGFGVLLYFFFPLVLYYVLFGLSYETVEVPVPGYAVVGKGTFTSLISQGIAGITTDFNDARNWYPKLSRNTESSVQKYSLSIPKLKIKDAEVSTIDYDLSKHLVQYIGTSIPGENGTSVIFGHSTLPQWFDPKNYKTIFATLHLIKNGDEIQATVNGVLYKYKVYSVTITTPEDTNMFSQSFDNSYITLVTCTPPGTVWKRLVVRAALEDVGNKTSSVKPQDKIAQVIKQ